MTTARRFLSPRNRVGPFPCSLAEPCERCLTDQQFLQAMERPSTPKVAPSIRVADLFAGCGAMTVGMEEAARRLGHRLKVALAVDSDSEVIEIYKRNVMGVVPRGDDMAKIFAGALGSPPTRSERAIAAEVGKVSILLGGPPCQGHSDLNNHTRRNDPKNALYLTMARAAQVLNPEFLIVENVAPVQ